MTDLTINGKGISSELPAFAQELVRLPSYSGQEEQVARAIASKMETLGYDEVTIDRFGSVLGCIGDGAKAILFESHTDTVRVYNADEWTVPPFSGEIREGCLWGRGSADMKGGLAASVYAAAAAKNAGSISGKRIYVSCSVFEEDCDGVGLRV